VRKVPPAPGFEKVLAPGDPEARARALREEEGIPIAEDIWQNIAETAESLNVAID
jgi:LDH2 family malate/lactate/ureidoglycolate dehydrogenase